MIKLCVCDCSLCIAQPEHHAKEILKLLLDKSTLFELQVQQGQGEDGACVGLVEPSVSTCTTNTILHRD